MPTGAGDPRIGSDRAERAPEARRERDFWGHHLPGVDEVLAEIAAGPDPNTAAMLDMAEPLAGRVVLDFACGAGVTTAWLAQRGARATGLDITPEAIDVAREAARLLGLDAEFMASPLEEFRPEGQFDSIVGRYALHHVDVAATARLLGTLLAPGGRAVFVETMASNPLLMMARARIAGRWGVPRLGTVDEHPLTDADVKVLEAHLGPFTNRTAQTEFLRILDRQVFGYRRRGVSRVLCAIDDHLPAGRIGHRLSYLQVLSFGR